MKKREKKQELKKQKSSQKVQFEKQGTNDSILKMSENNS